MSSGLEDSQKERYARHIAIPNVGENGQLLLLDSSILVVGAGGLGSPALLYLAAAGVGKIGIVDHDLVSVSNLQRQIIHDSKSVGENKARSAGDSISALNPEIELRVIGEKLTVENALEIIEEFDVVIDGTDNFESRYLIGDSCEILGKPWVFGSIHRFEGQVSTFNLNGGPNYRDLFPKPPPPELAPNCEQAGVLGVLPGIVGTIQATEAIKIILGIGSSLRGKLLAIDALSMEMRTLNFSAEEKRERVVSLDMSESVGFLEIEPIEFESRREAGWEHFLLDVRRSEEEKIISIERTDRRITHLSLPTRLEELPRDKAIVIYCRTGARSAASARFLTEIGWPQEVYNLSGGVHRWSDTVDSSFPKY